MYLAIDEEEEDAPQPEAVRPVPVETFYVPPAEIIREPTPPPHIPTEYQVTKEKLYLCDKIKAFLHSFHHKLGAICGNSELERDRWVQGLQNLEEDRLHSILESIKYKISAGGLSDMTFTMFASVTLALETTGPYIGLDLEGYSQAVTRNEQAREAIMEISADRLSSVVFSPEKRLALILLSTAYNVHQLNSHSKKQDVNTMLDTPMPETPTESFT